MTKEELDVIKATYECLQPHKLVSDVLAMRAPLLEIIKKYEGLDNEHPHICPPHYPCATCKRM